jgi:hypothetical protein
MGRFPRSVEIITQRPVIGSLRNSGKDNPQGCRFHSVLCARPRLSFIVLFRALNGRMRFASLEMRWKLRAESGFVQADNGRLAGCIVDRDDIETKRATLDVLLAKKIVRSAEKDSVLLFADAQLRLRRLVYERSPRANLHNGKSVAVEADEVQFAFCAQRYVVSSDKEVAQAPQVPIGVHFTPRAQLVCV